uniref:Ribonuclease H1 n=1 Tax=Cynoglossus semilaevis TaxID=244447 RepID=A0A3P8V345_CYNSE
MFRLNGIFRAVHRSLCSAAADDMVKGKFFYAVRKGVKPGVYKSWDECKTQVDKFQSASYKKFASEKEAWAFVRGVEFSAPPAVKTGTSVSTVCLPKRGPEPLEYIPLGKKRLHSEQEQQEQQEEEPNTSKRIKQSTGSSAGSSSDGFTYMGDAVVVYTDGCCTGNGKSGAKAGIGVYWGHNHPRNVSERLLGRQTNQRAELQAAYTALKQARQMQLKKLVLYTDSMFTINGVTKWVKNWKVNGWKLKSGGDVVNKDQFVKLERLNSELQVVWMYVPGHAGYTGNEEADRLSKEGAVKPYVEPQDLDEDSSDESEFD